MHRHIDPRRAAVYLAWTLAFAYSFAPFDFVFAQGRIATNFTLREPLNPLYLASLALHLVAFAAAGAADRFGSGETDPGNRVFQPVLARGLIFCLIIEVGQIFVPSRHAELVDLAVNAGGILLGHLSARAVVRHRPDTWARATLILGSLRLQSVLLVIWSLFWSLLLLIPGRFVTLDDWDSGYPLRIASAVQYVALYDRPLKPDEVKKTLDRRPGTPESALNRMSMGLIAAYGDDVPLTSAGSAEMLTTAIAFSGTFSVEVWCRLAGVSKSEPANIVGISDSIWRSNFTLGQDGQDLYFRVRNRLNGLDGSKFDLRSPAASSTDLVQIVATYAQGVSSVFENGQRLSPTVDLREPSVLLGLGTAPASRFVTALLSALSLIFLGSCWQKRRAMARGVVQLLLLGYTCLLPALVFGALFSFGPAVSLYMWLAPALILSSALLMRVGGH